MPFRLDVTIYKKREGEEFFTVTIGEFSTKTEAFRRMRHPWAIASYEASDGMSTNGSTIYFPPSRIKEYTITEI